MSRAFVTRAFALVLIVALGSALTGCATHPVDRPVPHALGSLVDGGGFAFAAPRGVRHWRGAAGSFDICLSRHGPVRILGARVVSRAGLAPLRAQVFDRQIGPRLAHRYSKRLDERFLEIGTTLGSPPDWSGPGVIGPPVGHFTPRLAGLRISHTCREYEDARRRMFKGDGSPLTTHEFVLTFEADRRGAWITGFDVHYRTADGRTGVARERWDVVACGSAIHDLSQCPKGSWG